MEMFDKLEDIVNRYEDITAELSNPDVVNDQDRFRKLMKEQNNILPIVTAFTEYKDCKKNIEDSLAMLSEESDEELLELAKEELNESKKRVEELENELKILLLPKDPNDDKDIIVEIRAGAGGDEAALFAAELFRMYTHYVESRGWKIEVVNADETGIGGMKEVEFMVKGQGAYSVMKYESGVHRVQRVPETESGGRIHTSTASVAVMPEAEEVDIKIDEKDIRIDVMRASGNGGQCVNTTDSALFMAGYLPGLLWGIGVMVIAGIMASKRGYRNRDEITLAIVLKTVWAAIPSLLLIVIVIGGILIGAFTATEGSAIAVVYSLLLSFIYRSIKIRDLRKILLDSVKMTAIVIFMIGVSSIMSWIMSFTNIPAIIADVLLGLTNSKIAILLIMNLLLLVVGTFMDPTPAILIFTPIFLPICTSFGMHPIHFGIMIVFNLCIGTITPPVGPILFTGCKVANVKIEEVFKTLLPYFAVTAAILLLVTYVPAISMTIPNVLGLVK